MTHTATIQPLTAQAFAPFGDVISTDAATQAFTINRGSTERFHDLANVQLLGVQARVLVSIFRAQPRPSPYTIEMMERHPFGSQAFVPLNNRPYWVAVALPQLSEISPTDVQVFLAQAHQGVNYHAGVWHHPLMALDDVSDFLVIDRLGLESNCDELSLTGALQLVRGLK